MNNKPIGYQTARITPDIPESKSRAEKIAELRKESESRSKRVQILITPNTYNNLKALSEESGASINEIINRSIESYLTDI